MYVCDNLEGTLSGLQLPSVSAQFPSAESVLVAMTEIAAIQAHNFKMVAELMVWQVRRHFANSASSYILICFWVSTLKSFLASGSSSPFFFIIVGGKSGYK
jgi:hypothetical protein